jgi:hypothetical protein
MNNTQIIEYLLRRIASLCGQNYADKERAIIKDLKLSK